MADCPRCGRPISEHALILYAGGPEAAFPEDASEAAVKARRLSPDVRDAPAPAGPVPTRSGTGTTARRRTAKEAAAVKAWRKLADQQKGKRE